MVPKTQAAAEFKTFAKITRKQSSKGMMSKGTFERWKSPLITISGNSSCLRPMRNGLIEKIFGHRI